MNRFSPERKRKHMNAPLAAAAALTDVIALPPVRTVVIAAAASVAIAVNIRRLRRARRLTGAEAATAVSVVGILTSTPLEITRLGTAAIPSASKTPLDHYGAHDARAIKQPRTQQSSRHFAAEVESCGVHDLPQEPTADLGRIAHTALVDRDENVLGCIDQLEKNGQLIRLDGGVHWSTFGSLHDARKGLGFSSPRDHSGLAPRREHKPGGLRPESGT